MIDLRHGDCLERMKEMEDNSIDLILTDPPYELNFMGKKWDNTGIAFNVEMWKEAFRVLKPGGYLMSFSSARTYHRMAVSIEDAGFEIKDMIEWVYGSGFPKSLDISKALDKKLGVKREVISQQQKTESFGYTGNNIFRTGDRDAILIDITKPSSDIAKQYEGYKTLLKPAHEPICLAMKPLSEKNFAENVMRWGTGGLNIDGARIPANDITDLKKNWTNRQAPAGFHGDKTGIYGSGKTDTFDQYIPNGRYPANFIIDENTTHILDGQSGYSKSRVDKRNNDVDFKDNVLSLGIKKRVGSNYTDEGGASRYFYKTNIEEDNYIPFCYTTKCSKKERNTDINGIVHNNINNHTTVKPKSILKYLLQLGLPPYDSVVLDMFAGSGSLGLAIADVNKETGKNHKAILIEMDKDHCEIIKKRCCIEELD